MSAKKIGIRFIVWITVALVFLFISESIYTAYWPIDTSNIAVTQFENSDTAYTALRLQEISKNYLTFFEVLILSVWAVYCWKSVVVSKVNKILSERKKSEKDHA